jgi:glycosyltransferase involved in cell wall biosynthesis
MIYAIIPAYNEEKTIEEVIKRVKKYAYPVVVDDGSKDKTYEIAKKHTIVIKHEKNMGKGYAVKTGIEYVLKNFKDIDAIVLIDADLQHLPEEIPKLVKKLKIYDFVQGCRDWSKVPFRHKIANFLWRKVFNFFFNSDVKDLGNGFIAMKPFVAKEIVRDLGGGYIIEAKMLKKCIEKKFKVGYQKVTVVYNRKSKILRGIKVTFGVLIYIIREGIKYKLKCL